MYLLFLDGVVCPAVNLYAIGGGSDYSKLMYIFMSVKDFNDRKGYWWHYCVPTFISHIIQRYATIIPIIADFVMSRVPVAPFTKMD